MIHDWGWEAERLGHSNRAVKMKVKEIKQGRRGRRGTWYGEQPTVRAPL